MTVPPEQQQSQKQQDRLKALRDRLRTVVAVTVTPFRPGGAEIDHPAHARLVRRLVDHGIEVVTPNGNTGEFYALDPAEARRVVETTVEAVDGRAEVMAGVGLDERGAVSAARHARDAGAGMVMVHQPVHPYRSAQGWIAYHREIAGAVPETGVALYVRDPGVDGAHLAALADACPNVIGVKYAVPDPVRFACVARDAGLERFAWIAGLAELSAPGYFAVGATGFTSGLANVAPRLSLALLQALRAADRPRAMRLWELVRPFEELRAADASADNVSVVKEALAQLGLCDRAVRVPSRLLPPDVQAEVRAVTGSWQREEWL